MRPTGLAFGAVNRWLTARTMSMVRTGALR